MLRSISAIISAYALVVATSLPVKAASDWRHTYGPHNSLIGGVIEEDEIVGMAYLKVPFGGPSHARQEDVTYGLALTTRMPDELSGRSGDRRLVSLVDLQFTADGMRDWRISGISGKQHFARLNAKGDDDNDWIWTYGLMAVAIGAVVAIVLIADGDGFKEVCDPDIPDDVDQCEDNNDDMMDGGDDMMDGGDDMMDGGDDMMDGGDDMMDGGDDMMDGGDDMMDDGDDMMDDMGDPGDTGGGIIIGDDPDVTPGG